MSMREMFQAEGIASAKNPEQAKGLGELRNGKEIVCLEYGQQEEGKTK